MKLINLFANFPTPADPLEIYVDLSTSIAYRWNGSSYTQFAPLAFSNSAGLAAALSDETGTGLVVFNNAPELINPNVTAGGAYKYNGANVIIAQTALNNYLFGGAGNLTMTGTGVIAAGVQALFNNTTGTNITALGQQAAFNNTTGNGITSVGTISLFDLGSAQTAGAFVSGISYTIKTAGTTDFTLIGAASNTVGVVFTATGVGAGTGTATPNNTSNNTALGNNTGMGIIHGTGNTILGANVTGLAAGLTNNVIIADGSGNQRINVNSAGDTALAGTIKTAGYTVATLPAGTTGSRAYVTDATAPTFLGALTGGGAVVCPVIKNATAWVAG